VYKSGRSKGGTGWSTDCLKQTCVGDAKPPSLLREGRPSSLHNEREVRDRGGGDRLLAKPNLCGRLRQTDKVDSNDRDKRERNRTARESDR